MSRFENSIAAFVIAAIAWAASCDRAYALATEHVGSGPITNGLNFGPDLLAAVNLDSRVYWNEVNGNPYFFFKGNTEALNKSLELFAKVKAEGHDVIIVPGSGDTRTFKGDAIASDWHFNVPMGLYFALGKGSKRARFTVYVKQESPKEKVDGKQVERWITDLDADDFAKREKAEQELAKLSRAVSSHLRKALETKPTPETERRLKALLGKLEGIDLDLIRIPTGLSVLDTSDLLANAREDLKNTDYTVRGMAITSLGGLDALGIEVIPELVEVLKTDKNEYVRRSASGALARIGKRSADALPILREGLKDSDVNVRNAFEQAVKAIEEAKEDPDHAEQVKKLRAIQEDISRFKQSLPKKNEK
jgi:hypothetical protein